MELLHDTSARRDSRVNSQYCTREHPKQQVCTCPQLSFSGCNYQPDSIDNTTDVGTLTVQCIYCGALKFEGERDIKLDSFPTTSTISKTFI